jgi:hypothetical protein
VAFIDEFEGIGKFQWFNSGTTLVFSGGRAETHEKPGPTLELTAGE